MKIISYYGADGDCIVIDKPTDLYPLLDWIQTQMVNKSETAKGSVNKKKWENCADFIDTLMKQAEKAGYGSYEDIDKVEYS